MTMTKAEAIQRAAQAERGSLGDLGILLRNLIDGSIRNPLGTEGGTGIVGIAQTYETQIDRVGDLIHTRILIDLTGLRSTASGDVIGDDGQANCHIGQINYARMGDLVAGSVTCLEAPAGGDPDIDPWSAPEATLAEDSAISASAGEVQLLDAGDHTNGRTLGLTALPADGQYLYLVAGATTDADYTAGKLLFEFWGTPQ